MTLGQSWTDSNCHRNICPGNICSGDICPYQEYLSCYLPNLRFLGPSLTDTNCHGDICPGTVCQGKLCPGNICPYQEYLSYYRPNFDQTFCTHFFGCLKFFGPKVWLIQTFLDPKFCGPKYFGSQPKYNNKNNTIEWVLTQLKVT